MKILVLNCGSSSLKYQLIDMDKRYVMAKGNYERIGEDEAFLTHKVNGEKEILNKAVFSHDEALKEIINMLLSPKFNTVSSLDEISGIGHRIVHGGEIFTKSVLIDEIVIENIEKCAKFAPLHNPAAVQGIRACMQLMSDTPMVATFDTAFHQTLPKESYMYPVPHRYYEKYGVRKYGAHGTSHKFVAGEAAKLIGENIQNLKIITCHIGQGASISAVEYGKCIDTSMGLTPLGGIPMVTRSGDMDPSVVTYIMDKENLTPKEMETILNKKSGLAAIADMVPDFRQIELAARNNEKAALAVNIFSEKIAEYIARYASKMYGVDAIVFTGGIGENQIGVREKICKHLEFMCVKIDELRNDVKSECALISTDDSKVKVYVIPTDEEMMIALDTCKLI